MISGYLLDTSFISQVEPGRDDAQRRFAAWLQANQEKCYLSTMTVTELERGVARLERLGHSAKARVIGKWVDEVLAWYGSRVIALDLAGSRLAGRMLESTVSRGHMPSLPDVLIAATARSNSLIVLTLNLEDFVALETQCENPLVT